MANERENTGTAIVREGFNNQEIERRNETSATAIAAHARAAIEAACVLAERHPRNLLEVRGKLLSECERPKFAESARYALPRKKWNPDTRQEEQVSIVGFSIRFAESCLRAMRNIGVEQPVIYEDDKQRILEVTVRDYESNLALSAGVAVSKTVERRKLKNNQIPIASRQNSSGQIVFTVYATDDEVMSKQNALISKAMRNGILRLVPADILEECEEQIARTKENEHAKDPQASIKRTCDAFGKIGVSPAQLATYLGKSDLNVITPKEREELLDLYNAIKDGETSFEEALDAKQAGDDSKAPEAQKPSNAKGTDDVVAKARANQAKNKPAEAKKTEQPPASKPKTDAPPPPAASVPVDDPEDFPRE